MATWEAILAQATEQVVRVMGARRGEPRTVHESLQGVTRGLAAAVIARPDHARLLLVEVLAVGGDGAGAAPPGGAPHRAVDRRGGQPHRRPHDRSRPARAR